MEDSIPYLFLRYLNFKAWLTGAGVSKPLNLPSGFIRQFVKQIQYKIHPFKIQQPLVMWFIIVTIYTHIPLFVSRHPRFYEKNFTIFKNLVIDVMDKYNMHF